MSERTRRSAARTVVRALTGGAIALAALALPAAAGAQGQGAQDAGVQALRQAYEAAKARQDSAQDAYFALTRRARLVAKDTVRAAGIAVAIFAQDPPAGARDLLAEGLTRGRDALAARWGSGALALIDTLTWQMGVRGQRLAALQPLWLAAGRGASQTTTMELGRQVDPATVERFVVRHAGTRLARVVPAIGEYGGPAVSLDGEPVIFEVAARELALSWSSVARRCHAGALADCRAILSDPADTARLGTWYDPADYAALATAHTADLAVTDSARWRLRNRCRDGDEGACATFVRSFRAARYPLTTAARESFVVQALSMADSMAFARLVAAPAGQDVPRLLAGALRMPEDSLLASWRERILAASRRDAGTGPVLATAALWSLVFLAVSTRRRPL